MILKLRREETAVLLFHLNINRKNMRKVLKKNYSKDYKSLLGDFDEVKETLEGIISVTEEHEGEVMDRLNFNITGIRMIDSFLNYYVPLLDGTLKKNKEAYKANSSHIEILELIRIQSNKLMEVEKVV